MISSNTKLSAAFIVVSIILIVLFIDQNTFIQQFPDVNNKEVRKNEQKTRDPPEYITFDKVETDKRKVVWKDDPMCSSYTVDFGQNITKIYLLSYPRSGNTWTRYMLEGASGIFTGSVFTDKRMISMGYYGESVSQNSKTVLFVKSHGNMRRVTYTDQATSPSLGKVNTPIVFLLRNPLRSIMSFWELMRATQQSGLKVSNMHTTFENENFFDNRFHEWFPKGLKYWENLASETLIWQKDLLVVHYGDLVKNPTTEIKKMLQFAKMKPDEDRLSCLKRYIEGNAKRVHKKEIDPYTLEEKIQVFKSVLNINSLLTARGYNPIPDYTEEDKAKIIPIPIIWNNLL